MDPSFVQRCDDDFPVVVGEHAGESDARDAVPPCGTREMMAKPIAGLSPAEFGAHGVQLWEEAELERLAQEQHAC